MTLQSQYFLSLTIFISVHAVSSCISPRFLVVFCSKIILVLYSLGFIFSPFLWWKYQLHQTKDQIRRMLLSFRCLDSHQRTMFAFLLTYFETSINSIQIKLLLTPCARTIWLIQALLSYNFKCQSRHLS